MISRLQKRDMIRRQSEEAMKALMVAHNKILSAALSLLNRASEKEFDIEGTTLSEQMHLIAQFLQGIDLTMQSILTGCYHQAANLLKQETEILAAIEECTKGLRKEGRTPNVGNNLMSFREKYGELNDIAHPSRTEIVQMLTTFHEGDALGPTIDPEFDLKLGCNFFGYHTFLLVKVSWKMDEAFRSALSIQLDDVEAAMIMEGFSTLASEGQISIPERPV